MIIRVQLFAYLAKYSPTGKETFQVELNPEATVDLLWDEVKIPPDLEKMVLVNGHRAKDSTPLKEGDEVFIFPPVAGG